MKHLFGLLRCITALTILSSIGISQSTFAQETIQQAVSSGEVIAEFQGIGGSSGDTIKLKIRKSPSANQSPLDLTVPPGTMLNSGGGGFQSMTVAGLAGEDLGGGRFRPTSTIHLTTDQPKTYILNAYCAEFEKDNPDESSTFTLRTPDPMLACISEQGRSLTIGGMQAAVWMHTDNITYEHMSEKFGVTRGDWDAAREVYRTCSSRN